jgi:hypothetical protein
MQFHFFKIRKRSLFRFSSKNMVFSLGIPAPLWDAAGDKKGVAGLWKRATCHLIN